jgi:hypothetical protein
MKHLRQQMLTVFQITEVQWGGKIDNIQEQ